MDENANPTWPEGDDDETMLKRMKFIRHYLNLLPAESWSSQMISDLDEAHDELEDKLSQKEDA